MLAAVKVDAVDVPEFRSDVTFTQSTTNSVPLSCV
jgi:hypothetical protein